MSTDTSARMDFCVFHRGKRGFAISTHLAKEVIENRPLTAVPFAPPELLGALNLRGEVVPLVALDSFLDVPARPPSHKDALLVLGLGDLRFAAVVDRVARVVHFAPWEIRRDVEGEPPPGELVRGYSGTGEDRLIVLDGETLIGTVVQRIAEGFRYHPASEQTSPTRTAGPEED
ncbi:MAG: chemotaxis protein CheW [Candidatus Binatia bacterium]|nr:chemotaxis protein CheW [Candidatus Binatia bacterium]